MKIPLYDIKLSPGTINKVNKTLRSGWLSSGGNVAAFEKAISRHMLTPHSAAVSSATDGLLLMLKAAGIGAGDEVITTPFTFVATVASIIRAGAAPVLADIDAVSLNLNPLEVSEKITKKTKAVLAVDVAGYPASYEALRSICHQNKLSLLSDSAHAIGTLYYAKPVSCHTDGSVLSFHATKNLLCGEGGMVLSRNRKLIDAVRKMRQHGLTSTAYERQGKNWQYDAPLFGYKANMSELHAAVGLGQLTVFEKEQQQRERLAVRYLTNLAAVSDYIMLPYEPYPHRHGWHLFLVRLRQEKLRISRDKFIELMAQKSVECGVHYRPIFELSYYRKTLGLNSRAFPQAARAGKTVVTLPLYPHLSMSQVDYVCNSLIDIVVKHRR